MAIDYVDIDGAGGQRLANDVLRTVQAAREFVSRLDVIKGRMIQVTDTGGDMTDLAALLGVTETEAQKVWDNLIVLDSAANANFRKATSRII